MGSTTLLDIIGSMTTFGLLLLAVLRLNASASENSYAYNQNYLLQRNMVVLTVMLEDDLKHVGMGVYALGDEYGGVLYADTSSLKFRAIMVPGSNKIDTVEWKAEAPPIAGTPNSRIFYVDRILNGKTQRMNLGATRFKFQYWNITDPTPPSLSTPITGTDCGNIGPVSVEIRLESPYKITEQYTRTSSYMADTSQYDMVWRQLRSISRNNSIQFPQ
jgi:hypothetical protein